MKSEALSMSRFQKPTEAATKPVGAKEIRSARDEMVQKFLNLLNPAREATGYKPLTESRLNRILSRNGYGKKADLYPLFKECEKFDSFGAGFWFQCPKR